MALTIIEPSSINTAALSEVLGGGTDVYATLQQLPLTNNNSGALAFVSENNRLYLWNGTGWFNIALINTSPTITTAPSAIYQFATNGIPTIITLVAQDPEGIPITWSYQVTGGSIGNTATVSQNNNVFTITPSTNTADIGEFQLTFTASDGINIATANSSFKLSFGPNWAAVAQQAKLVASDAAASDSFGFSVSIDADTIVVGATGKDIGGAEAGAAYVFTRTGTTWIQQANIQANDKAAGDNFGYSVDVSADTLVVGAYGKDTGGTDAGAAYVFTRTGTTWTQQAKLQAGDAGASDYFGISVAINNNTVVVGAFLKGSTGKAYVFTRTGTTWTQQAKLEASDGAGSDNFGLSLDIDADTLVVGAQNNDSGASNAGAAYVFTRTGTTWTQQAKLQASGLLGEAKLGFSVAVKGNTLVAGAKNESTGTGAAYVFTRTGTTWTQQAKLQASDLASGDNFGQSVALATDTLVVGAWTSDTGGTDAGAAYVFTRTGTTWTQKAKLLASDPLSADYFGVSVSVTDTTAVVGAWSGGANDASASYVFKAG